MRFAALITVSLWSALSWASSPSIKVFLKLSPTGSFEATSSTIKGAAKKEGGGVSAQGVSIPLSSFTTGMALRDSHMKDKYLEVSKCPNAEVTVAKGENGKGSAKIKLRGVEKEVSGTYKDLGNNMMEVKFPLKLSDFKIEGIRYMGVGVKDQAEVVAIVPVSP